MTTTLLRVPFRDRIRGYERILVKELAAFGVIGAIAFGLDIGIFTALASMGAIKAKTISSIVSTTFAYLGNRYLSFSHRARTGVGRETAFFFGINALTLGFSLLAIALFVYPLGFDHDSAVVFIVNLATIALGTVFRFWSYKRFVFLHPDKVHAKNVDLDTELAE